METVRELQRSYFVSTLFLPLFTTLGLIMLGSVILPVIGASAQPMGVPRDQITVPVCPVEDVTDRVLCEEASDPGKKLYLARYRIAEQIVSGQPQYQMSLGRSGQGWNLAIHLERYPPPEMMEAAREAMEINHTVTVILKHHVTIGNPGDGQKELVFQDVTAADMGLRAVLHVDSLSERDRLYQVITNPDYGAVLVVRRTVKVAIPVTPVSSGTITLRSAAAYGPDTCLQGYVWREASPDDHVCVPPDTRAEAISDNHQAPARRNPQGGDFGPDTCLVGYVWREAFPNDHACVPGETRSKAARDNSQADVRKTHGSWWFDFDAGGISANGNDIEWNQQTSTIQRIAMLGNARLANLGTVDFDAISAAQLQGVSYSNSPININNSGQSVNKEVFAALTGAGNYVKFQILGYGYSDQSYDLTIRWVTYLHHPLLTAGDLFFLEVARALEQSVDPYPFVFSPTLHGYIFRDITAPGAGFSLIRLPVLWHENSYSYYQDQAQSYVFYYLPDSFKVARRRESPHYPVMSVRFSTTDGAIENTKVNLEYVALPFVNPARLQAASEDLKNHIAGPFPPGVNGPVFAPLLADAPRFRLALPGVNASAGVFQDRTNASVDLQGGIRDILTLSVGEFQAIFDAIFGRSAVLFQGEVVVKLTEGLNEVVPFTARMDDLVGDLLDSKETPDETSGGLTVTLRNAIESPLLMNRLEALLQRGEIKVPGEIRGLTTPVTLRAGEEVIFTIHSSAPISGSGPLRAVFDFNGVEVLPNPDTVWKAILDPNVPAEYSRSIQVKTFREMFDPPQDQPPENQIMAILVEFERGNTVELNADRLDAQAVLNLPMSDIILRRMNQGEYRYRVMTIRKGGQFRDEMWKTDSIGILFPRVLSK
jgi:hypothetical protein